MELISIPIDIFQEKRKHLAEVEIPTIIQRAIDQLKSKFPLLTQSNHYHGNHSHGHGQNSNHGFGKGSGNSGEGRSHGSFKSNRGPGSYANRKAERPRIGTRELSREDMSRKDFVANMNKLSRQNYDSILRHIRTTYNSNFLPNYMDIVWQLMMTQADYQDLHVQVIEHLLLLTPNEKKDMVQEYWNNKFTKFFDEKQWIPGDELEALLFSTEGGNSEEYDEFCDYIKWKKRIGATFQAWIHLMEHNFITPQYEFCFQHFVTLIDKALEDVQPKYIDCLLEWFLRIHKIAPVHNEEFMKIYKSLDIDNYTKEWLSKLQKLSLSSSFRFKIMDITEIYHKKCQFTSSS